MKKQMIVMCMAIAMVLLTVGGIAAQDSKKMDKDKMKKDMKMDMAAMMKSPNHSVMMAHRQNVLTFAKTLRDMSAGGKLEDVDLARNAFAEIKHSMEKMDEIHQAQMGKMSSEKLEMMKPMMEKMKAENTIVKDHILALEKAFEADQPDVTEINKHAAALVEQMEKMDMSDKKMKM